MIRHLLLALNNERTQYIGYCKNNIFLHILFKEGCTDYNLSKKYNEGQAVAFVDLIIIFMLFSLLVLIDVWLYAFYYFIYIYIYINI